MNKERILMFALLIVTAVSAYFLGKQNHTEIRDTTPPPVQQEIKVKQTRLGGHTFTNPLLECDCNQKQGLIAAGFLEQNIRDYILQAQQSGKISHAAVYFRDLNNGPWFGINEDENFTPASLLKVVTMIAVFKKAIQDPLILKKSLLFKTFKQGEFGPVVGDHDQGLVSGHSYLAEDLISQMIIHSDNEAAQLLIDFIGKPQFDKVLTDLQVVSPIEGRDNLISVKEYSSFFRVLYNASYLNKEYSERALKILSQTTFNKGLVAKLPKDLVVSHKFGERGLTGIFGSGQLHDCGIIYTQPSPYLLCVMTRGNDNEVLASVVADISEMVYNKVNGQNLN